jgi:hypothetical protein
MSKDNKKTSTAEWVIPVSVLAVATGVVGSYSIYKLKSLNNPLSLALIILHSFSSSTLKLLKNSKPKAHNFIVFIFL